MPPTVLGIAGSPRRDGNTDTLLRAALRGAAEGGADVEFLAARDLQMRPCLECGRCGRSPGETANPPNQANADNGLIREIRAIRGSPPPGRCVIPDDAQAVHDKLLAADHLVFATPIFFAAVSAQAKTLIDRCQCFWSLKYIMNKPLFDPPRPGRRGLWLACCGFDKRWMFDGPRRTMKALFNVLEFAGAGELCYKHVDARGDIGKHPTALADAFQAGLALAAGQPVRSTPSRPPAG